MSSSRRALVIAVAAVAALGAPSSAAVAQDERPPVDPIPICVDDGSGALRSGTAVPRWAGVHDPRRPVQPELLNWFVAGVGCVAYPGPQAPRASCGGPPRPVVTRVTCQR